MLLLNTANQESSAASNSALAAAKLKPASLVTDDDTNPTAHPCTTVTSDLTRLTAHSLAPLSAAGLKGSERPRRED